MQVQPAYELLESLARATWERLQAGKELNCSQGEETITDVNLLDIMRARLPNVRIVKFDKDRESHTGLDWEWWIGSDTHGWWRYAVQAKKLGANEKYDKIRYKPVDGTYQIDLLKSYSTKNKCVPIYCFYNYLQLDYGLNYWHCGLEYEDAQFGCTVAGIDVVELVHEKGKTKSFQAVHQYHRVVPWRCLIRCPSMIAGTKKRPHPLATGAYAKIQPLSHLPHWLYEDASALDHYIGIQRTEGIAPKRVMVITLDDPAQDQPICKEFDIDPSEPST